MRNTRIYARIGIFGTCPSICHRKENDMLKKADRTMERYMRSGAMMRLYKTLGVRLLVEISAVLSAADQEKMHRAMSRIDEVCSRAEDNMFLDHPELSNQYLDVFYGSTDTEPRNDVDRRLLEIAREAADELFDGERD